MWTLYACGLNPRTFDVTEAALVQNTYPDPPAFPKMVWATNYTRLVCQVMFTLFFGGKAFAPKAIIDGKNIQDYLQDHFLGAVKHLAQRIHEAGDLEDEVIIGWESINEPHRGLIGCQDLAVIPKDQQLQRDTSPTAWQAILTGSGRPCEIDTWEFGGMGPYKSGSRLVDPHGVSAWLPADHDDTVYGWKRDPGWRLGECVWAQHGIWDPATDALIKPDYFAKMPDSGDEINYEKFTNTFFMDLYRKYSTTVRNFHTSAILLCQPPVLEIPPTVKNTADDDPNMVFAAHFYDGITLLTKKWNRLWNVDVFGILRGKYWAPAFAIKIGEPAIRNCFRDQLSAMRQEGMDCMGERPCLFTEIGIPFDMDDGKSYKDGNYSSQIAAMDANHYAIEGSHANGFTLWTYTATVSWSRFCELATPNFQQNDHRWGDQWNGEDLSIVSVDDTPLPSTVFPHSQSALSLADPSSPSYSRALASDTSSVKPSSLKQALSSESMTASKMPETAESFDSTGHRAGEAYVRPSPVLVHGDVVSYGFDLRNCTFKLDLTAPTSTSEDAPTEVFLPQWHFPVGATTVETSGGKWAIQTVDGLQTLRWWHAEGEQTLSIKGMQRKGLSTLANDDASYFEQYKQQICVAM